jgi:CHASE2 domain-containing sensor protein
MRNDARATSANEDERVNLRRYYLRAAAASLFITVLVGSLERAQWFQTLEKTVLDLWITATAPEVQKNIFILEITQEDYRQAFHSTSPLDPRLVVRLITNLREAGPAVIAVDLDTSDPIWEEATRKNSCLRLALDKLFQTGDSQPPVIWAETPDPSALPPTVKQAIRFRAPLAGQFKQGLGEATLAGAVMFPKDSEGVVRHYRRKFDAEEGSHLFFGTLVALKWPGIPHAARSAAGGGEEDPILDFRGGPYTFPHIPMSTFLPSSDAGSGAAAAENRSKASREKVLDGAKSRGASAPAQACEETPFVWPEERKHLLQKSAVLIGGTYKEARDEYATPVGTLPGVVLLAHALYTEALGRPIRTVPVWWGRGVDFLSGLAVATIFLLPRLWPQQRIWQWPFLSVFLFVATFVTASALLFHFIPIWFSVVPVVFGMTIHELLERNTERQELRRNVKNHRDRVRIEVEKAGLLERQLSDLRLKLAEKELADSVDRQTITDLRQQLREAHEHMQQAVEQGRELAAAQRKLRDLETSLQETVALREQLRAAEAKIHALETQIGHHDS